MEEFFVYCLTRPDKTDPLYSELDQPFWFGKGSNRRERSHRTQVKKRWKDPTLPRDIRTRIIIKLWEQGLDFKEEKICINLSEAEALIIEQKAIAAYGRIDNKTGCLANLTDGGEGVNGLTEESKNKMSRAAKIIWQLRHEENPVEIIGFSTNYKETTTIKHQDKYQILRWYWQGYSIGSISIATDYHENSITQSLVDKCIVHNKNNGGGKGRIPDNPAHQKDTILGRIRRKYGHTIYKMWLDYPNNPNISQSDLAKAMGVAHASIWRRLKKLYGYRRKSYSKREPMNRETMLSEILSKYGPAIHKMVLEYPNDPAINITDIGKLLCVSKTAAGTKLKVIHGKLEQKSRRTYTYYTRKIKMGNSHIQTILDKNGIKVVSKIGTIYKVHNGISFVCRKVGIFNPTNAYRISYANTDIDFFICWLPKDLSLYVIPGRQNKKTLYLKREELNRYKFFNRVKNLK